MQELTNNTLLHGGTYRIIKMLGQGSFGITYLAEHTSLGKKVAIKEFFMKELNSRGEDGSITGMSDGSLSHNYGQKFKKESINLSRLEHPNIVRVTDSFDENGTFYYVMEYIDGMNLNEYLERYSPSEQTIVNIIKEVAKALQYMHNDKHMLHLDLKPGNIMRRNSDGHIFLIDFGLSKHYSSDGQPETSTTIGLGTAGYAPVEQSNQAKNGEFRPTIDVYALGATLYKLLTRETPPAASELVSDDELLKKKLNTHRVNAHLANIVIKAMLPNVRNRTQSVNDFIKELDSGINTDDYEQTKVIASETTIVEKVHKKSKANFRFPLTISVNKTIYTDCQKWNIINLQLLENKTVINMTVQSLNEYTTAMSGTGKLYIDNGRTLGQKSTSLPTQWDEDFIINPWQTIKVREVYPAVPTNTKRFSLKNEIITVTGINIENGSVFVPEENTVEYIGVTEREIDKIFNNRNNKSIWSKLFG